MSISSLPLVILRPEPGAAATANRAEGLGFRTVRTPLFTVAPRVWTPPEGDCDALLLTSANAPRHGGEDFARYRTLPCLAVGEATAEAARQTGLSPHWVGRGDAGAALTEAAAQGYRRLLWLCGEQHMPLVHPKLEITVVPVYSTESLSFTQDAREALSHPAIIMVHSQRAGWALAEQVRERAHIGLIAISPAVAAMAGDGWAWVRWPDQPRDDDMLELAATLCHKSRS